MEEVPLTEDDAVEDVPGTAKGDRRNLMIQAAWHGLAAVSAIALWAAADTWALVSELPLANGFSLLASIVFGIALSHLFHEWGHFAGARLGKADSPVKDRPALLMFDFDYTGSTPKQFLTMSMGGTAGNLLFIYLVWAWIPMDSPGRAMLLAAGLGMLAYVAVLEFPVIKAVSTGREPLVVLAEVFGEGSTALQRAPLVGLVVALIVWLVIV